ncbi:putative dipeptidase [Lachnellula hyalina]|uniref:Dipeptidase n=1 Tax=Lachnellula hyalina TaxID=1316788 RepID=A0A8H8R6V1_9HELO|nr:putative dipeptidase [Lachnellula hyalina]TVY29654.1 putative dipeptidase [Lachnellula hyalina]
MQSTQESSQGPHPYQSLDIDERVERVLKSTPLFDGHNDLPQQPRCIFKGKVHDNPKFDLRKGFERGMTDIPRLREGAVGAQFWSICVPCLRSAENFSTPEYSDMARDAIEQIEMTRRMLEECQDTFQLVLEPGDVRRIYDTAIFDTPRNVPDDVLHLVAANNGIVMVTFVPEHCATKRKDATMEMVLDHLFHIANLIGWQYVGLGSDFDGIASVIPRLEDVKCYPGLMKAILDRGATEEELALCIGDNLIRVWTEVAAKRDEMKATGVKPVEDVWEGRQWWRYDGYYQIPDPDPEDKLGYDWYGVPRVEKN